MGRRRRGQDRTSPSHPEGGGGDREAQEAVPVRQDTEEAVPVRPGDEDPESADGHSAKRQRPGIGREEQTRTYPGQGSPPVEA